MHIGRIQYEQGVCMRMARTKHRCKLLLSMALVHWRRMPGKRAEPPAPGIGNRRFAELAFGRSQIGAQVLRDAIGAQGGVYAPRSIAAAEQPILPGLCEASIVDETLVYEIGYQRIDIGRPCTFLRSEEPTLAKFATAIAAQATRGRRISRDIGKRELSQAIGVEGTLHLSITMRFRQMRFLLLFMTVSLPYSCHSPYQMGKFDDLQGQCGQLLGSGKMSQVPDRKQVSLTL